MTDPAPTSLLFLRVFSVGALALGLLAGCNTYLRETGEQTVIPVAVADDMGGDLRVGRTTVLAAFELDYGARFFGGLSGLWVSPDGGRLVAVTDHGDWVSASLSHDSTGRLTGIGGIEMAPLGGIDGDDIDTIRDPEERDAESLTVLPDGRAMVSFERRHRIWVYDEVMSSDEPLELRAPEGFTRLQPNAGIETLEALPDGRLLAIAEGPIGPGTVLDMWVLDRDGHWQTIGYAVRDEFAVTDAAALPDGRVIVLERWFAAPDALLIRLRELTPEMLDGVTRIVDPRVIAEFTRDLPIDNFEGLSARTGPNGETLLYMVSDDNFSERQTTYLYQLRLEP